MSEDETILGKAQNLTTGERQKKYGHPSIDFNRATRMYKVIDESDMDDLLKHPLRMICIKIARLMQTPDHIDSVIDIAGYANTYGMVLEKLKAEDAEILAQTTNPLAPSFYTNDDTK